MMTANVCLKLPIKDTAFLTAETHEIWAVFKGLSTVGSKGPPHRNHQRTHNIFRSDSIQEGVELKGQH